MKFKRQDMLDMLWESKESFGIIVQDDIIDHARWSVVHRLVFKHDGRYYQTTYRVGATESQDEGPWDYEDEVQCEEVIPLNVTKIEYVPAYTTTEVPE